MSATNPVIQAPPLSTSKVQHGVLVFTTFWLIVFPLLRKAYEIALL